MDICFLSCNKKSPNWMLEVHCIVRNNRSISNHKSKRAQPHTRIGRDSITKIASISSLDTGVLLGWREAFPPTVLNAFWFKDEKKTWSSTPVLDGVWEIEPVKISSVSTTIKWLTSFRKHWKNCQNTSKLSGVIVINFHSSEAICAIFPRTRHQIQQSIFQGWLVQFSRKHIIKGIIKQSILYNTSSR